MMRTQDIQTLREKADALKARWPIYGEMVDWLAELLAETLWAEGPGDLPGITFDASRAGEDLAKGRSLFETDAMPIDTDFTRELFQSLAMRTEAMRGRRLSGLEGVMGEGGAECSEMIRNALNPDPEALGPACREKGADPEAVRLLLRLALRPSLRRISRAAEEKLDFLAWAYGHCPVCGSPPGLAELGNETKGRLLYCSLCETSWAYPRFQCPFCENDNRDDLDYFYAEGEEGLRLDLCRRCGQHLKTVVDSGYPSGPIIPILDDLVTTHLVMAVDAHPSASRSDPPGSRNG